jgi:hypothetical protein
MRNRRAGRLKATLLVDLASDFTPMKIWLKGIGSALLIAVLTAIVTNLITGQPLTGLVKLEGLSQAFLKTTVPAWAFAITFFVAVLGTYQFTIRLLKGNRKKGTVHFVPDAYNNGWAPTTNNQMQLRAGGTFTYAGKGNLIILRGWLKGTQPTTDFAVNVIASDGSGKTYSSEKLWLPAGAPVRAFIYVILTPARGIPGKPLRDRLILRDSFNRDYVLQRVEFPYTGKPIQQAVAPSGSD